MKLKALVAFALLVASVGVLKAETVTVSSSTVTTIVGSNSGRKILCLQNATTNPVYYSKYSSSATVTAGSIMVSSATIPTPLCFEFSGAMYGLAGAGASGTVKYHESLK